MKWCKVYKREPVNAHVKTIVSAATGHFVNIYSVPPDKLLVLEVVSVQIHDRNPDQQIRAMLEINFRQDDPPGQPDQPKHGDVFAIPLTKTTISDSSGPKTVFEGTQSLRLYVKDFIMIGSERDLTDQKSIFYGYISGYLVPHDSPTLRP